mmetsp:Transcript_27942/g.43922  ORF Transcript_27942/g.43922 Transcript_27942/m.43922 type:complete len:83 (+) Transcript_27942:659-907(+)
MYFRNRRVSFLRKRAAPELEPGTLTAWKYLSGMGGSINGGFLSPLEKDEDEVLLLLLVEVSSVSEIRNTFDVELIERCRYVS